MSKQSEAKERQGYTPKPIPHVCGTCGNITSDLVEMTGYMGKPNGFVVEKNIRCGIGGFAVKKMATCDEWRPRNENP